MRCGACSGAARGSGLPVVSTGSGRAGHDQVLVAVRGPDPDLVVVGAVAVGGNDLRPHQDPRAARPSRCGSGGRPRGRSGRRRGRGLEALGALRRPHRRGPVDHQRPLLLAVLVVVRADRLPGRDLVEVAPVRSPRAGCAWEAAGPEAVGADVVVEGRIAEVDAPRAYPARRAHRERALFEPLREADAAEWVAGLEPLVLGEGVDGPVGSLALEQVAPGVAGLGRVAVGAQADVGRAGPWAAAAAPARASPRRRRCRRRRRCAPPPPARATTRGGTRGRPAAPVAGTRGTRRAPRRRAPASAGTG